MMSASGKWAGDIYAAYAMLIRLDEYDGNSRSQDLADLAPCVYFAAALISDANTVTSAVASCAPYRHTNIIRSAPGYLHTSMTCRMFDNRYKLVCQTLSPRGALVPKTPPVVPRLTNAKVHDSVITGSTT